MSSRAVSVIDHDLVVWIASLDELPADAAVLSADEKERAGRFLHDRDRIDFIRTRRWLRTVLAAHLRVNPPDVYLEYGPHGKPFLRRGGLHFNLAHSRSRAMLAVSTAGALGVDIERVDGVSFDRSAARHVLSARELDLVDTSAEPDLTFLRVWVRKEAFGKALGCGLDAMLPQLTLGLDPTTVCRGLRVVEIEAGPDYVAALAYDDRMAVTGKRSSGTEAPYRSPVLRHWKPKGTLPQLEVLS